MAEKKIPGIYNYCDRWCERCSFGSRCAVYENQSDISPEENDIKSKAFWERLSINFAKAHKMIEHMARERGIDLNEIAVTDFANEEKRNSEEESRSHPLATFSLEYMNLTKEWNLTQPGLREKLEAIQRQLELDPKSFLSVKSTTDSIQDALSVIQWYQAFIHVKFIRSLTGKKMNDTLDGDLSDENGSAKVAILAVERSMQAWMELYDLLPEHEDYFLKTLSLLERIKKIALQEFPNAMAFKRPGFDD
jgi:hypothetical protein